MDYFQLVATISLVTQMVVLVLLFGSLWLKGKKQYRQHGITMLTAVVVHLVVVLAWMLPEFYSLLRSLISINLADIITLTALVHAVTGIMTAIFGIWLVASWHLQADIKTCFAKKGAMRVTLTLWLIALVLGIILYLKIIQLF